MTSHWPHSVREIGKNLSRTPKPLLLTVLIAGLILFSASSICRAETPPRNSSVLPEIQGEGLKKLPSPKKAPAEHTLVDDPSFSPEALIESYAQQLQNGIQSSRQSVPSPDHVIIPDKKNTGIAEYTRLKTTSEFDYIGTISEEERSQGHMPLFLSAKTNEFYNINGYANDNCASRVIIEGYNFEDAKFYVTNDHKLPRDVILIFKNCKFGKIQSHPGPKLWIILDHCQVEKNIYASNMIILNSYLHSYNCDALNPVHNVVVKDSYIADLFRAPTAAGVHIDGVQIFGNRYGGECGNIFLDNVRFSLPQIYYEGSKDYVNTAIITGLKFSEGNNFLFQNITIDAAGRWYPLYNTGGDSVLYKNVQVANGYRKIFYSKYFNPGATVKNVDFTTGLYVSSVWKDEHNKTHFLCSNNNAKTDKTLTVVTDQKKYNFHIDRHPTPSELMENPTYQTYRFEDLPYDIEFVIEEDISQAVFYDGSVQIRSVEF